MNIGMLLANSMPSISAREPDNAIAVVPARPLRHPALRILKVRTPLAGGKIKAFQAGEPTPGN